ncbi:MAG: peptide deformylase [Methylococcales bacterium]
MTSKFEIAQLGAKVLRLQAEPITDISSDGTQQLIKNLLDTLATTEGVGIAAPQVSISKQIIIVASRPTLRYPKAPVMEPTVMINPTFTPLSEIKVKDWEGCLSIPSIRARVPRYKKIQVNYLDHLGSSFEIVLEDFVARVFQHEFDHLQGKVYLDQLESNEDIYSESEYLLAIK